MKRRLTIPRALLRRTENFTIVLSTQYMDEAEKLAQHLILMPHGKIVVEGVLALTIDEKVKTIALEVREAGSLELQKFGESIIAQKRGLSHLYFAQTPDELTPLMNYYGTPQMLLRPSNLEDVFLQIVENKILN